MNKTRFTPMAAVLAAALAATCIVGGPSMAVAVKQDPAKATRKQADHDMARQAVLRREVVPLPRILTLANGYQPGDVIEVELESKNGRLIYDVHVLTDAGAVRELLIDARNGKLVVNRPKGD